MSKYEIMTNHPDIFGPLSNNECPDCGSFVFRPGPRGGFCQNIECARCRHRFNVAYWNGPTNPYPEAATLIMAHRLPSETEGGGAWREDMFPQVLE